MASRTAKVASSIIAGILAGVTLTVPRDAAKAAECLTEPRQDAAQGQHWYYRIERGTKRHCWYLRGEGDKVSQAAPSADSEQAPKATARTSETPPRALEDAHAEFPLPQARGNNLAAPVPGPAPLAEGPIPNPAQADTQGSTVAARWPSSNGTAAPATPPAAADSASADPAPVADPAPATDTASVDPAPSAPVAAGFAPVRPSLQMLFAVIGGALALAGLTASIVYRLARGRRRRLNPRERRAALWEGVDTGPRPPWVEPVIEETAPRPTPERRAVQSATAHQRHEKIEEILEQLVRQAQQSDA